MWANIEIELHMKPTCLSRRIKTQILKDAYFLMKSQRNTLTRKGKETEVLHIGERFMKNSLQKNLKKLKWNSMDKQGFFVRSFKWFTRQGI